MKKKKINGRILDAIVDAQLNNYTLPRYLRAYKTLKVIESITYTDTDLRGLSKAEKAFMHSNDNKIYVDENNRRYYIFIARDLSTGRRRLYAIGKRQWLNPNGHDISQDAYNYECWLIVNTNSNPWHYVSPLYYERRFCQILTPVVIL